MIALLIIGAVLLLISYFIGLFAMVDPEAKRGKGIAYCLFFIVGVSLLSCGLSFRAEKDTYKKALEHNPYKKEYIYKQVDSTYVVVDSVYVKKEEE